MEFSRQEYWSGLTFPSPGDLPDPGVEPRSPTMQAHAYTVWATRGTGLPWQLSWWRIRLGWDDPLEKGKATHSSILDFPGGSDGKASAYNAGDPGLIPGLGRSSGEGNGDPVQYSCLEKLMDGEAS